jgi:hypothetical protein
MFTFMAELARCDGAGSGSAAKVEQLLHEHGVTSYANYRHGSLTRRVL